MLLGWWIFLYAFIVFPHQYVNLNVVKYNVYYDRLYWRRTAFCLLVSWLCGIDQFRSMAPSLSALSSGHSALYAVNSSFSIAPQPNGTYYSGSLYDIPSDRTVAWAPRPRCPPATGT